jgi:mono/diheme cytochrome c family protein
MQNTGSREQRMDMRRNTRWCAAAVVGLATLLATGCRQDMQNEPKFYPQRGTDFYPDGRSVRPQVENTVARDQLHQDAYFYTGLVNGKEGDGLPFPVSATVLARGQERFNVYCTPCHSRVGNGQGMIVMRGYAHAGNLHSARLEAAPLGHFFNVMTNGYGAMPDYSAQLTPADRWAVTAYIRALQLSQKANQGDVPSSEHVQPLSSFAESEGLPTHFADDWTLPPTAIRGTPSGEEFVLPAPGTGNNAPPSTASTGGKGRSSTPGAGSGEATPQGAASKQSTPGKQ